MDARHEGRARIDSDVVRGALDRWEGPLLRYAASFVGVERARDVVQETFLRLWEGSPAATATVNGASARSDEGLAPWLFTVCRNRAIDIARKEGRMQLQAEIPPPQTRKGPVAVAAAAPDTPFEQVARHQDAGQLRSAVSTLPERQRELVRLRYEGGLSYKEMAAATGLSVSNVGYQLHVALKALRTHIGGDA